MDHGKATDRYYARWLGAEESVFQSIEPVQFFYSEERNRIQRGHGAPFALYCLVKEGKCYLSFGDEMREFLPSFRDLLHAGMDADTVRTVLERSTGRKASRMIKYVFVKEKANPEGARCLFPSEYPVYAAFFEACWPGEKADLWLREYFDDSEWEKTCCGVFSDGRLVCATDSPAVPYLEDEIREIGINTLPGFRRRGYGTRAAACAVREILAGGKTPIWSTGEGNEASQKLAGKVGFAKYADCLVIEGGSPQA